MEGDAASSSNAVDSDPVPCRIDLAMDQDAFDRLAARARARGVAFDAEPHARFEGMPGEQRVMFFRDPSGNALEFKTMKHPENLFARYRA